MITVQEKEIILRCAKKYNVSTVFIFGSSVKDVRNANDIDVGVEGVEPGLFFKFYAELFKYLPKPVDLVDLSDKSLFTKIVKETGVKIYG